MKLPSWPVALVQIGAVLVVLGFASAVLTVGLTKFQVASLLSSGALPGPVALFVVLGLLGVVVLSTGLIAYVIRNSLSHERAEANYAGLGTILACFASAVIVANVLSIPYVIVEMQRNSGAAGALTPGGLVLSVVALDGSLLGILYLRLVRPGVLSWRQMGVKTQDFWLRVGQGIGVGVFVILASAAIAYLLQLVGVSQTQDAMFAGVRGATPGQFLGVLLAGAFIAPVAEELFFRGYVFTAIHQRWGLIPAFATSSLLFALAHLNLQAFLPILLIGLTFCLVYWRTGSLVPSMIAHAMNNALALTTLYLMK